MVQAQRAMDEASAKLGVCKLRIRYLLPVLRCSAPKPVGEALYEGYPVKEP